MLSSRKFRGRSAALLFSLMLMGVATLIGAKPAFATVMVEVPFERLVAESDAIVLGTVTKSGTRLVLGKGDAKRYTFTTLRVSRWLKGVARTEEITLQEQGGSDALGGMRVEGTPEYRVGEQVVVFLAKHPQFPGRYRTYGMCQGKFTVVRGLPGVGSTVTRDMSTVALATMDSHGTHLTVGSRGVSASLDELLARIAAAVGPQGGAQ